MKRGKNYIEIGKNTFAHPLKNIRNRQQKLFSNYNNKEAYKLFVKKKREVRGTGKRGAAKKEIQKELIKYYHKEFYR